MATRTWDNGSGDGNWSTDTNWSDDTKPTTGDDVVFDSTSTANCSIDEAVAALSSFTIASTYTGTITVNVNQSNTFGTFTTSKGTFNTNGYTVYFSSVTINSGATVTAGASIIYIAGSWYNYGTFTVTAGSTSKIVFTSNGFIRAKGTSYSNREFWGMTINSSVVMTLITDLCSGYYEIYGTLTGSYYVHTHSWTWSVTPLTISSGTDISGIAGINLYCGHSFTVPSYNSYPWLSLSTDFASYPIYLGGNITCYRLNFGNYSSVYTTILDTQNYSLTVITSISIGYIIFEGNHVGFGGALTCGSSIITVGSFVRNLNARDYITFNTSSWTVSGNWTCASTSSSWSAGTATINFNGTSAQTLGLNNGNSSNIKYYNITISNSRGSNNVVWGANTMTILGSLTCTATFTTGSITCATNNPNFAISGGFSLANGTKWTKGTGTMTFNGTQNIADNNSTKQDLGTVTTSGAVTVTQTTSLLITTLTIVNTSTWTTTDRIAYTVYNPGGSWNRVPLPTGTTTVGTLNLNVGGTLNSRDNFVSEPFDLDLPIKMGVGC